MDRIRASSRPTKGAVAGPGIFPEPDGQVHPNDPAPHRMVVGRTGWGFETLDIRVLHRFPEPWTAPVPVRADTGRNLGRARWHLHRFLGFLLETGRVRMPPEIRERRPRGGGIPSKRSWHKDMCPRSIAAYRKALSPLHRLALPARCRTRPRSMTMSSPASLAHRLHLRASRLLHQGPADSRVATNSRSKIGLFISIT